MEEEEEEEEEVVVVVAKKDNRASSFDSFCNSRLKEWQSRRKLEHILRLVQFKCCHHDKLRKTYVCRP